MQAIFRLFVGMELYPLAMELHYSQGFPDRNVGHLKFKNETFRFEFLENW